MKRFVFNPEHDLCLANGDVNFAPPASALKFGEDCSEAIRNILWPVLPEDSVSAWGWDNVLKNMLLKEGVKCQCLPSDDCLAGIRRLSHRRIAIDALSFVRDRISSPTLIVRNTPEELVEVVEVEHYLAANPKAVFKAPWSGSGKGLRWVSRETFNNSDAGWCRNVIARQGSLIAEVRQDVCVDFAMLFKIKEDKVEDWGYSLFETRNGAYSSSRLLTDSEILDYLSAYIPIGIISETRELVKEFVKDRFAGAYEGFLGVDMFVCRSDGSFVLNPAVEINVRMTMGLVARVFRDQMPSYGEGGYVLSIIYAPESESLSGLLSGAVDILSEVKESSRYALAVYSVTAGQ